MNKKTFVQILIPVATALVSSAAVYFTMAKAQEKEAREETKANLCLND